MCASTESSWLVAPVLIADMKTISTTFAGFGKVTATAIEVYTDGLFPQRRTHPGGNDGTVVDVNFPSVFPLPEPLLFPPLDHFLGCS